ncbi:hypothetical protein [Pontibacter kalidii]|uniref:hypothetical protein n=1 Tax=Pontibacter kalidii TaxID=2592049 RepID=UPI002257E32C|nr:hypothetical protein [Pontibacter kalidii]
MKNNLLLALLLLAGCSQSRIECEHKSLENASLVEYTYRENEERNGYDFYLANFHQLSSDGSITLVRRGMLNAPLRTYTSTAKNLTEPLSELIQRFPSDTSLLVLNVESRELSHGFMYMLLLTDTKGKETVVSFSPRKAEGALRVISDSLLLYQVKEGMRAKRVDSVSLIATYDSVVRKHVLSWHPLPPNSLPPPLLNSQLE